MINPDSFYINMGNKLRNARIMRGLSQQKLVSMLDNPITFQQLQKYEKGSNRISVVMLIEVSRVLKVPLSYFIEEIDVEYKQTFPRSLMQLSDSFLSLPYRNQKLIMSLAKELQE